MYTRQAALLNLCLGSLNQNMHAPYTKIVLITIYDLFEAQVWINFIVFMQVFSRFE